MISALGFLAPITAVNAGENEWTFLVSTSEIVSSFALDPNISSTLFAGTRFVYKTADGGGNWTILDNGITSSFVQALVIDPNNPATLYAGTGGGVFKTTNGGGIWNSVNNGLGSIVIYALVIDPHNPSTLYAGTFGRGVFKTTNGGNNWTAVNNGVDLSGTWVKALAIDPQNPGTVYAGTASRGAYKTTNGGNDWNVINNGFTVTGGVLWNEVWSLAIDPRNPGTLYCGMQDSLFKTTNGGSNWSAVNDHLTGNVVTTIAIDPVISTTLYVGTRIAGVFKSTNGGNNWSALNNGLDDPTIHSLVVDPGDRNTLYVGVGWAFGAIHKYTQATSEPAVLQINAGLNGSWFYPGTNGQGFFIDVFPVLGEMFVAWFTFDTEHPDESVMANLGHPGQRWLTAQGAYADNQAVLDIYMSGGGLFDTRPPIPTVEKDGTLTFEFTDCETGTVTYDIPSIGRKGVIPIERISDDNVGLCQSLDELAQELQ